MTIISGLIITHVDRRVKRGQPRKEILLNKKRKGRKKRKLKTESRYICMSLKCFHVSLINHIVSTWCCVDIGVKLNAHIPKISTASSHQRIYHSVLNMANIGVYPGKNRLAIRLCAC